MFCLIKNDTHHEKNSSKLYRTGNDDVCKISFSSFDYKRYILDDGINSLAYFHKDILIKVELIELIESVEFIGNQVNKKLFN